MSAVLSISDMKRALELVGQRAAEHAEELRVLDAATGDGDLGVTMTIGWGAVRAGLAGMSDSDMGQMLGQAGMAFNRAAASTFGVLLATLLMRAGRELRGASEADLAKLTLAAEAGFQGVKERGKADVGDKTMLDALWPAVQVLQTAVAEERPMAEAFADAARAARTAAEATAGMTPKFGRASWLGPRAAEVQDPGATATAIMLEAFAEAVRG